MGIGTSLGAYFDNDANYEAGVEEVIKPPATGDNNVVTPQKRETDKQLEDVQMKELGGIDVSFKTPSEGPTELRGALKDEEAIQVPPEQKSFLQRLSIINTFKGMMNPSLDEDIQMFKGLWSALKLPGDVLKGEIDPSSPEGIQKAFDLALTIGTGRMPKAKMEAPAPKPLEGDVIPPYETMLSPQQQARETIESMRRVQERTRQDRSNTRPEEMSDDAFYQYGLTRDPGAMTPAQEARWLDVDRRLAERDQLRLNPDFERFEQIPFEGSPAFDVENLSAPPKHTGKMADRIAEAKKNKEVTFFETPQESAYGVHYFANDKGVGELKVNYKPERKTVRVTSIGIIEDAAGNKIGSLSQQSYAQGPQTFGAKDTKQILKYIKEKYPEAEWITGYRVSGARDISGGGAAEAKMWIGKGPKPKPKERKTIQQLNQELDDYLAENDLNGIRD